jgi:hypothetical protein
MQDISIQGAPPPLSPVNRAFAVTREKPRDMPTQTASLTETAHPAETAQLSDHDLFHLEIEAEEDGAIEIPSADTPSEFFGKDGLTFGDILDVINPLHHIPGISTVYRDLTGDEISPGARLAGGALFGGPIGFAMSAVNTVVETATGSDIGETVMAALIGDDNNGAKNGDANTATATAVKTEQVKSPQVASAASGLPANSASNAPLRDAQNAATTVFPAPAIFPATAQAGGTISPQLSRGAAKAPLTNLFASSPQGGARTRPSTPAEALLQARAAVPSAGAVRGLNTTSRSRFQPQQIQSQSGVTTKNVAPATQGQAQNGGSAPRQIGVRMSEKLALLAAQSQAAHARATPSQQKQNDVKASNTAESQAPAPLAARQIPTAQIPNAMRDALERYEQMKLRQANPGLTGPSAEPGA